MRHVPTTSTPTTAISALELDGLAKSYGRGTSVRVAVRPTTLSVPWGQVIGLLGPNGAGKTTLIKMVSGLVTPTAGTARVGRWDIGSDRGRAVLQIGAVLEGSRNVYWPLSAWENLLYFGHLKGLRRGGIDLRAEELLRALGLWSRRHEPVGSFSRGMQQKVAVAAALIADPPILLLDEPTLGLDVESARTFKEWIAHLARDEQKTILLTTHQLHVAQELADRIAVIREGEIIADLPTGDLLARYAEDRYDVHLAGTPEGLAESLEGMLPAGARLLSIEKAQPTLEEVFIRLLREDFTPVAPDTRDVGR